MMRRPEFVHRAAKYVVGLSFFCTTIRPGNSLSSMPLAIRVHAAAAVVCRL